MRHCETSTDKTSTNKKRRHNVVRVNRRLKRGYVSTVPRRADPFILKILGFVLSIPLEYVFFAILLRFYRGIIRRKTFVLYFDKPAVDGILRYLLYLNAAVRIQRHQNLRQHFAKLRRKRLHDDKVFVYYLLAEAPA